MFIKIKRRNIINKKRNIFIKKKEKYIYYINKYTIKREIIN